MTEATGFNHDKNRIESRASAKSSSAHPHTCSHAHHFPRCRALCILAGHEPLVRLTPMKRLLPILLLLSAVASFAAVPLQERGRQGYVRRMYGMSSGLPEQTVHAFAQTPDHYLWIG